MSESSALSPRSSGLVEKLKIFLIKRFGIEQILDIDRFGNHRFYCKNPVEIFRTHGYGGESLSLPAFLFMLKHDDVVWDIGASIGLQTVHAAAIVKQVVSFEPDPSTSHRLRQNVQLNNLAAKVRLEECALSDKEGQFELHTDGLVGNAPTLASLGRHSGVTKVPVRTVDQLLAQGVPSPTVLKIDVEGGELSALRGAAGLLASPSAPRLMFVEIHPEFLKAYSATQDDVTSLVRAAGYHIISPRVEHGQCQMIAVRDARDQVPA